MTTLKLKPEIKARWLTALRSGKYLQGKGRLRSQDNFCCLGVLGDLAVQDGLAGWEEDVLVIGSSYYGALFPEQLLAWACASKIHANLNGDTGFPLSDSRDFQCSLSFANDELGNSFEEIACLVEKYL